MTPVHSKDSSFDFRRHRRSLDEVVQDLSLDTVHELGRSLMGRNPAMQILEARLEKQALAASSSPVAYHGRLSELQADTAPLTSTPNAAAAAESEEEPSTDCGVDAAVPCASIHV